MSVFGSSGSAQTLSLAGAQFPVVVLVPMPNAGTEYSLALPSNCKQFLLRTTSGKKFQVGYLSLGPYLNVPRNCFYGESGLSTDTTTLFFVSSLAGETAEIITWV